MLLRITLALIAVSLITASTVGAEKLVDFDYTYRLRPQHPSRQRVLLGRLPEGARISLRIEPIANGRDYFAIVCGPARSYDDELPCFGRAYKNKFDAVTNAEGVYLLYVEPIGGNPYQVRSFRLRIRVTR